MSLTTYGTRLKSVHLTIQSIMTGRLKPTTITLWLDDHEYSQPLPRQVADLIPQGLQVRQSENVGPHGKYLGWIKSADRPAGNLITADDDIIYPRNWLQGLSDSVSRRGVNAIHAYRCRVMEVQPDSLPRYANWPLQVGALSSPLTFLTGVSGVLYPPAFIEELARVGDGFRGSCDKADDVWINWVAQKSNFPIYQIGRFARHFPVVGGSQLLSLQQTNVNEGANDQHITQTFGPERLAALSSIYQTRHVR